jgi:hypothetical protein
MVEGKWSLTPSGQYRVAQCGACRSPISQIQIATWANIKIVNKRQRCQMCRVVNLINL